jgi:hypothetical protein
MWWLNDGNDFVYQFLTPKKRIHLSQPQPSVPKSKGLMLYFFMQSEQALWPKEILALQKIHAADLRSASRLSMDDTPKKRVLNLVT